MPTLTHLQEEEAGAAAEAQPVAHPHPAVGAGRHPRLVQERAVGAAQVVHVEPGGIGAAGVAAGAAVLQHGVVPRHRRVLQGQGAAGQPPHQEPAAVLQPHRAQHHAALQHLQPVPGAGGRAAAPRRFLVAGRGRRGGGSAGRSRRAGPRLAGPGGGGQRAARALEGGGLGGLGLRRLRHLTGSVPKRSPPGMSAAPLQCRGQGAAPGAAPPAPSAARGSPSGECGRAGAAGEAAAVGAAGTAGTALLRAGAARGAGEPLSVADRDAVPAGRERSGAEGKAGVGGGGRAAGSGCGAAAGPGRGGGRAAGESSAAPPEFPRAAGPARRGPGGPTAALVAHRNNFPLTSAFVSAPSPLREAALPSVKCRRGSLMPSRTLRWATACLAAAAWAGWSGVPAPCLLLPEVLVPAARIPCTLSTR